MLLLHCSGKRFLGYFLARMASFLADLDLGCIGGVKGSPVEVSVCQAVAWVGRMDGPNLIACCCFFSAMLLRQASSRSFSGDGRLFRLWLLDRFCSACDLVEVVV